MASAPGQRRLPAHHSPDCRSLPVRIRGLLVASPSIPARFPLDFRLNTAKDSNARQAVASAYFDVRRSLFTLVNRRDTHGGQKNLEARQIVASARLIICASKSRSS
jgi:hypothetical protein